VEGEATRKEKEAEEARHLAKLAVEDAKKKDKEAREARQRAIRAVVELKREIDQKTKVRKFLFKKSNKASVIFTDDGELLVGTVTLTFDPGEQYNKVSYLVQSLSTNPNLKEVARGDNRSGLMDQISPGWPHSFILSLISYTGGSGSYQKGQRDHR
jgi:hypothetical protein